MQCKDSCFFSKQHSHFFWSSFLIFTLCVFVLVMRMNANVFQRHLDYTDFVVWTYNSPPTQPSQLDVYTNTKNLCSFKSCSTEYVMYFTSILHFEIYVKGTNKKALVGIYNGLYMFRNNHHYIIHQNPYTHIKTNI